MLQDKVFNVDLPQSYTVSSDEGIFAEEYFVNKEYKDALFRLLFKDRNNLLSLYNALNHSSYDDPEQLEIKTLEKAIYMGIKNDLSFIIDNYICLYEHQSENNPNMPLRYLLYISAQLKGMYENKDLHRRKPVRIPVPRFIVFYNGLMKQPDYYELKLSDLYEVPDPEPPLELKAQVYNINLGHNTELLEACRTLKDYATYVDMVRRYSREYPIKIAVDKTIDECIQSDILRDFLIKHRQEARQMSILEYDYKGHMEVIREEGKEDGYESGRVAGFAEGEAHTKRLTAINMLKKGLAIDLISELSGLTQEEIMKLREEYLQEA